MSWKRESQFINVWMNELETVVFDLRLQNNIVDQSRRLLTRVADADLTGTGHDERYVALGCFYVACTMCGGHVSLERILSIPLCNGLSAKRTARTIDALLRRLGLRICYKCGKEAEREEKFCTICRTWIPRSIVSMQELEKCLSRASTLGGYSAPRVGADSKSDEHEKISRFSRRSQG